MKIEIRHETINDELVPRGLVLISESKEESALIDAVCGDNVKDDGLIALGVYECRLSDGYGDHYLYIRKPTQD